MPQYTMEQTLYPCVQPWTEIFYDGQVHVVDNRCMVDRSEWRDALIIRGFVEVQNLEEPKALLAQETLPVSKEVPVVASTGTALSADSAEASKTSSSKRSPGRPKKDSSAERQKPSPNDDLPF